MFLIAVVVAMQYLKNILKDKQLLKIYLCMIINYKKIIC